MPNRTEISTPDEDDLPVNIVPGVGILGVFGHLNYQPWFALAEFVDNALQSATKSFLAIRRVDPSFQLEVDISYERENGGLIVIADNAGGIARRDFARAFKAAELPPDRTGLSEFGMGMKSASIWFARNWRVVTTSVGDPNVYTIEFDMDTVLKDKIERLNVAKGPAPVDDHYTRIELWNLNQFLAGRTLGKVRDHLREIYRAFLRDDRLILSVAGQNMEFVEPEILMAQDYRAGSTTDAPDDLLQWRKELAFELDGGVRVHGWAAIRAEGKTSGTGISLFRRGRVIVGTGETPYRPVRIYGQGNSYRSQRLFGELEIDGLPVSHTKDGFQWHGREEEFEEALREALDADPLPLLKQAEHYRARQASRIELRRIEEATANTAEASQAGIPQAVGIATERTHSSQPTLSPRDEDADRALDITKGFTFIQAGKTWAVTITAASRTAEPRWLISHIELEAQTDTIRASLTLNTAHPFLKQFALGSTDALEAVLRIAVALVVSESLLASAGDAETAATFMRQLNTVLGSALSTRLRSDT